MRSLGQKFFLFGSAEKGSGARALRVHAEIRRQLQGLDDNERAAPAPAPSPPRRPKLPEVYRKYLEEEEDERSVEDELDRYLREPIGNDSDIRDWWKQRRERFPRLYRLALQLLVIPATSASAEREFSEAGHVFRQKRLTLNPNTASDILLVHSNSDLLK
ncbi:Putative AC9 transposase [Frankliniella fusca]|uniref:AC9 transposase n=1 Tax=Frankliniella fusca TaxID=407009 RepID=A0AAE1HXJ5_9NEOP|nr:Putative AC9 transposase [Frankliniella fusca]